MGSPVNAAAQVGIAKARDQGPAQADAAFCKELAEARATLQATFLSGTTRTYEWRMSQLQALKEGFSADVNSLLGAMKADLQRHDFENTAEFGSVMAELQHCMSNLKSWMAPERVATPALMLPGSSRIEKTPKGVVLILAPWNFPANLALIPLIQAVAAGNCVLMKPSDVSRNTEQALRKFCDKYLDRSAVRVLTGGIAETTEMLSQQWDHIFYTGNAAVGRIVMKAAAQYLTPVTLELGGKSPVIVDSGLSDMMLRHAAERILWGAAYVNAGQICVSPDFCLVMESDEQRLLKALKDAMKKMDPDGKVAPGAGRIINQRHFDRVKNLAETSGGEAFAVGKEDRDGCYFPATVISRPSADSPIASEEIFGPLLSVIPVKDVEAAASYLNGRETPLALYIFSQRKATIDKLLANTRSGGVCINDTIVHLGNPNLPFGGAGASGFGAYHGKSGFDEFTHKRSVLQKSLWLQLPIVYPPYDDFKASILQRLQMGPLLKPGERRIAWAAALGLGGAGAALLRSCL
mmetsp:Transcript_17731/g.41245  ORF Transcript_17731/g.41245 Transcript_17731/m.41245 type:complete len:521 (-) Transcript_17731:220-1782(-)